MLEYRNISLTPGSPVPGYVKKGLKKSNNECYGNFICGNMSHPRPAPALQFWYITGI
jgi:hypothetical protein